jgi:divalent metal cation (Fe/Co/Zn/Cd) transporter
MLDPSVASTQRGLWVVKVSLTGLLATGLLQMVVALLSGSVALLANTVHNLGDALTAVPLGIALILSRRRPNKQFPWGLGRL